LTGRVESVRSAPATVWEVAPILSPPDPREEWSAEIAWSSGATSSLFQVIARRAAGPALVLAESAPVEWPPSGPQAIRAMSDAAAALDAMLLEAGWRPLPPGSSWYAKRFAWDPPAADPGPPLLALQRDWPEEAEHLWRCEIEWAAGYARSHFQAVVYPPGERRGQAIGTSAAFSWTMKAPPDPRSQAQVGEVRRLTRALRASGWEPVGRGARWYSARCVWHGDEPPAEQLELGPAKAAS
jgi:hypothetical protein